MSNHRLTEKAAVLKDLRIQAQRLGEMAAAVQLAMRQIALWGGPTIDDFGGKDDPNAATRLEETVIALEGAALVMQSLNLPCAKDPKITAGDAMLRIAQR